MDVKPAKLLIQSLLDRLEADALSIRPKFSGVVSALERAALATMIGSAAEIPAKLPESEPQPDVRTSALEISIDLEHSDTSRTDEPATGAPKEAPDLATEIQPDALPKGSAARPISGLTLNETALTYSKPQDDGFVLCLDFGTAKSKAAAATAGDGEIPDLLDLGLGRRDSDIDSSVYTVNSSIWISDAGLMFAGSEALRQSIDLVVGDVPRRRLDSIKHQLSLANVQQRLDLRRLEPDINPTSVELMYEDALCFFLAFLTDLAGDELAEHGRSRYMRRRFTIPSWRPEQRSWASGTLSSCIGRAQLLADSFHGRWKEGIPAAEFKRAVTAARKHDTAVRYLIDKTQSNGQQFPGGLLEPLAAGSGRVWADRSTRNLVLVIDVGAGTTDFSLFWVVQDSLRGTRKAFPIAPCSDAVRMAGDIVDELLLKQILARAPGESNGAMRNRMEADLRQRSLRRLKERLFETGKIDVRVVTDHVVTIEREEFESLPQFQAIGAAIEKAVTDFLGAVSETWGKAADRATLVLTGGSAKLPIIQQLAKKRWFIAGRTIVLDQAREVPNFIEETFDLDFQREYPQLAVAIGGALPVLDEKDTLVDWLGGAAPPGQLERYRIKGS